MIPQLLALLCLGEAWVRPSPANSTTPTTPPINIELSMGEIRRENEQHPFAWIRITNTTSQPVAVSKSFYAYGEYIYLHIESGSGEGPLFYPEGEQDLFAAPEQVCLKPGQTLELGVDLFAWRFTIGGEALGAPNRLHVRSGSYRIKAGYSTRNLKVERGGRCKAFQGLVESDWVEVVVSGSGGA